MASANSMSRSSTVKQGFKTSSKSPQSGPSRLKGSSKSQRTVIQAGAGQRMNAMFNDPAHMENWVASSAVSLGSSPPDAAIDIPRLPVDTRAQRVSAISSADFVPALPTAIRRSTTSDPQIESSASIPNTIGASRATTGFNAPRLLNLNGRDTTLTEQLQLEAWAYPSPQDDGFSYPFQDPLEFSQPGGWEINTSTPCDWSGAPYPGMTSPAGVELHSGSYQSAWTPTSIVDSSISSSYSQTSILAGLSDTPISPYLMDHHGGADLNFSMDAENGQFQALNLGEPIQNTSPTACFKETFDAGSTVRPSRPLERTPLSNLAAWPPSQITGRSMTNSNGHVDHSRQSSSGEPSHAREHHYYSFGPKDDGLYHCPFGFDGDCTHKPEKLKCNYDKHLDSHLKPYRCKISACSVSQFSSTACLLRHEREAHGMHGHGEKPHLCYFSECDRSVVGNGFPRRWNLFDHMKRVHDYTGSGSSSGSGGGCSPPSMSSSDGSSRKQRPSRHLESSVMMQQPEHQQLPIRQSVAGTASTKRRQAPSPAQAAEPMKRSRSNQMAPATSSKLTSTAMKPSKTTSGSSSGTKAGGHKHRQSLQKSFEQQKAALQAQVDSLQPYDAQGFRAMTAHYQVLNTVAMDLQRQGAADVVSRTRRH